MSTGGGRRIGLVSCGRQKAVSARSARDLYVSDYFRSVRDYVEATCEDWRILSGLHGLVHPQERLEPYEQSLSDLSSSAQSEWARKVVAQLQAQFPRPDGIIFEIHAGAAYSREVVPLLKAAGYQVVDPLRGQPIGRRVQWYRLHRPKDVASRSTLARAPSPEGPMTSEDHAMIRRITTREDLDKTVAQRQGYLYNDFGGSDPRNCPIHRVVCSSVRPMLKVRSGALSVRKLWSESLPELVQEIGRQGKVFAVCRFEPALELELRDSSPHEPGPLLSEPKIAPAAPFDRSRAQAIGRALGQIPESVYEAIDRGEPEWPLLGRLCEVPHPYGVLTALAIALSDFQLGTGGATQYWKDVATELDRRGTPGSVADVHGLLQAVMRYPSAARHGTMKLARVERLLESPLVPWLRGRSIEQAGNAPMELWALLAAAMRQASDAKTIVFAMKIFDLLHKIDCGQYVVFPARVPIVVDLRIGAVSLSSGLMGAYDPPRVLQLMATAGDYVTRATPQVRDAWTEVAVNCEPVSLFRIDSLVWQVSEPIYKQRRRRTDALRAVVAVLERYGADQPVTLQVASELTHLLPKD